MITAALAIYLLIGFVLGTFVADNYVRIERGRWDGAGPIEQLLGSACFIGILTLTWLLLIPLVVVLFLLDEWIGRRAEP